MRAVAPAQPGVTRQGVFESTRGDAAASPFRHQIFSTTSARHAWAARPARAALHRAPLRLPRASARSAARPAAAAVPDPQVLTYDFVVLGSGIAGLSFAIKAAKHGRVALVTKGPLQEGCTVYAQGGICAVLDHHDSWQAHAHDTTVAGAFLNSPHAVEVVCREGPDRVLELAAMGAAFTRDGPDGPLHLTREGGHSHRRIVHAADATGAEVMRALMAAVRSPDSNVDIFEHHHALDLVTGTVEGVRQCIGVDCLGPPGPSGRPRRVRFLSGSTMLATGGAGQVYPSTTNPATVTGDGIAMAYRAGVAVANMEFVQFHPTSLYQADPPADGRAFLITEAVRGEGGILLDWRGRRFMPKYDPRGELAPRDIVARAIVSEMELSGKPHVWLSIAHKGEAFLREHFPTVYAKCLDVGIDIARDPIPVLPAQHYLCGGVQTTLLGETSLPGLYASGEVAHTGLHGANRLASNSLLEGLVFSHRAVEPAAAHAEFASWYGGEARTQAARDALSGTPWAPRNVGHGAPRPFATARDADAWAKREREALREAVWEGAGIARDGARLAKARSVAGRVLADTRDVMASVGPTRALSELANLATIAELIAWSGASRVESRGGHFRLDFPECLPGSPAPTVVRLSVPARPALAPGRDAAVTKDSEGADLRDVAVKKARKRKPASRREAARVARDASVAPVRSARRLEVVPKAMKDDQE